MEVESSSPLAAMQSNAFRHPSWSLGNDSPSRSSLAKGGSLFGPKLKVAKPRSKKHDSGTHSSPTSVLAADLSQNFHIDKT